MTPEQAKAELDRIVSEVDRSIKTQLPQRSASASIKLKNAATRVLGKKGNGRRYKVAGTKRRYYNASGPGWAPAVQTGAFRASWMPKVTIRGNEYHPAIESNLKVNGYILGGLLENGTSKMAYRPHHDRIKEIATPAIYNIFKRRYFR